jgi:hypothetical protein
MPPTLIPKKKIYVLKKQFSKEMNDRGKTIEK